MTNCPNCGAPIQGSKCQYCGTMFYDFTELPIDFKTPVYVKIKPNNGAKPVMLRVIFSNVSVTSICGEAHSELNMEGYILSGEYMEDK